MAKNKNKLNEEDLKQPDVFVSAAEHLAVWIRKYIVPISIVLIVGFLAGLGVAAQDWWRNRELARQTEDLYRVFKKHTDIEKQIAEREQKKMEEYQAKTKGKKDSKVPVPEREKGDFDKDYASIVEGYSKLVDELKAGEVAARGALYAAEILSKFKKHEESIVILKKVVGQVDEASVLNVLLRMQLSYHQMEVDKVDDAMATLLPLTRIKMHQFAQPQALMRLGVAYFKKNNWGDARATFSKITTEFGKTESAKQAEGYLRLIDIESAKGQAG